ncbi:erythronate4-phosphate dehydrogenase domain containing protein [Acanthamoeba castellanii str. Neff]|uniref:Erythronate4-phosphate dehydrogenase domain containing protein n=1 Tax=Acanthamoeba castellanii (strain ATCC 30010 / Neff) TaxID=1257118 RepID=L8GKH5_ACACF|nr:erythronate4-phosphate dehydrogenase domain containing protein [Acanthamoeba castellanii str. Neff]ELR13344.1 erythronate4-phosphate dehydrogenase domain containing protein [Acanthamoeba castellanii str. Neff]
MPREEVLHKVTDVDAIICHGKDKADAELVAKGSKLKVISNFGAGYDTVDVKAATERNIWVCNTPGAVTNATADVALYLLLAACRRATEAERFLRDGSWERQGSDILAFWGNNPEGKTLGIIGMGNIGKALAKRAAALDMRVIYYKRTPLPKEEENGATYKSMDDLLAESDFISIHTPLTDATRHILGRDQFAKMKKGVYIINTARGPVIDEEALVEALKAKIVRGAGLDVFEVGAPGPAHVPVGHAPASHRHRHDRSPIRHVCTSPRLPRTRIIITHHRTRTTAHAHTTAHARHKY